MFAKYSKEQNDTGHPFAERVPGAYGQEIGLGKNSLYVSQHRIIPSIMDKTNKVFEFY